MSGVKTEVDGRVAVADERMEFTRAVLVSTEVRASCAAEDGGGGGSIVAGIKATTVGRLTVTC